MRTRAYRRKVRQRKIRHNKYISQHIYGWDWYEVDGRYAKNKVYCGCPICKPGKYLNIPTVRDRREKEKCEEAFTDYEYSQAV